MNAAIGKKIRQPGQFSAFVPNPFPPKELLQVPEPLMLQAAEATRLVGKLDGVIHTLPDVDCFLKMFIGKDAEASSQIEGTKATLIDALKKEAKAAAPKADDSDDILYYIKALDYGLKKINKEDFPLSLRLIRGMHKKLMTGARATHFADPGEFRASQNYIGGTRPGNAVFVPPPVHEMHRALGDFEKFLYKDNILPLIHIAIMHAQFETIHPFLDGNGRTGRLLITLLFCRQKLLEKPALFLSSYFKTHQKMYYHSLHNYHEGKVGSWLSFFLSAVSETAAASIRMAKKIRKLRDDDMLKIQSLAKRESESGVLVLLHLFRCPLTSVSNMMEWTGFTRAGAQKVINRFVALGILSPGPEQNSYGRLYTYKKYLRIFKED